MQKELADFLLELEDMPAFLGRGPVSIHSVNPVGETPLHVAAIQGKANIVQQLIEAGADINAPGEHGYTPLHEACAQGKIEVVELLLRNGADVAIENKDGNTPLELAEVLERRKIEDLLKYPPL